MKYHYRIINKLNQEIHSDSANQTAWISPGVTEAFKGWESEHWAEQMAWSRMSLCGLKSDNWYIEIYSA